MRLLYEYDFEEAHMTMGTASQYCLRWNNHQTNLLNAFDALLRQEAFTDVTLACEEGITLHAHRLVLAACSSYFSNLFSTTSPAQHPIIVLKDVRVSEMRALLNYMYRGEVNVEQNQLKELLKVAEGLRVKGLVEDLVTNTQTHPLPLVTSTSQPLPLLVPHSQRHPLAGAPSPSPSESRSTPNCNDRREMEPSYGSSIRAHFHSPPHSPYKHSKIESKEEQLHPRLPSPHHHPYFSPYLSQSSNLNHPPRVPQLHLDMKERKSAREIFEREKLERPSRPSSEEYCSRDLRLSPPPISQHFSPYSIPPPDSPPVKRPRQIVGEPLGSPTPILRTALAHTRPFQPDVSSLVSLANSIIPLPPLLSARTASAPTDEELRRASDQKRELSDNGNPNLPKKTEPMSDDDSRQYIDITKEDESQDKMSNGPLISDFPSYHLDQTNTSHFSNFVSYVPAPKPEWKRYKQYTKTDLLQAIEAVRKGMTALQASRKYKVPSRTLYDKIKKMGINTLLKRSTKRTATTDIDFSESSLAVRHMPPLNDSRPSTGELYREQPPSREHISEPSLPLSLPRHPSQGLEEGKKESGGEDVCEPEVSTPEEPILEAPTRGSFSFVGTKVFGEEDDDSVPLDLTDTEGPVSSRAPIQERA